MTVIDQNVARAVSTNVDTMYLRRNFMPTVANRLASLLNLDGEPDHRFLKEWVDPLNPTVRKLRRLPKRDMQPVIYANQKMTTLSYQIYGTTSLWWLPLLISGHCHPHEVPPGSTLFFPQMKQLAEIFEPITTKQRRGSVVRT